MDNALAGKRVLVLEDDFIIGLDLTQSLQRFDCVVMGPVASVTETEALLVNNRPDLALLDLEVRGGLAWPLMPTLRRLGVPFAIMTGHEPGSPQLAAGEGMPVLSKPFGEAELRAILLELVGEAGR